MSLPRINRLIQLAALAPFLIGVSHLVVYAVSKSKEK